MSKPDRSEKLKDKLRKSEAARVAAVRELEAITNQMAKSFARIYALEAEIKKLKKEAEQGGRDA